METVHFEIANTQSTINWIGRKVTGSHNGTIGLQDGSFTLVDGKLSGGKFTIDTTSIKILDIADAATNAQFAGHLASDDFFSSEKFPEAKFVINTVTEQSTGRYHVEGDLTIKGITQGIDFDATLNLQNDTINASGKIAIDRTRYDMKFRSGNFFQNLGDTLIYNNFELDVNITAKAVIPSLV